MTQPSLFRAQRAPKVRAIDIADFISALRGRGWMTAKALRAFGSDRVLRAMAEHSEGRIISGQQGYRLLAEATIEEVQACIGALESQSRKMALRAAQYKKLLVTRSAA